MSLRCVRIPRAPVHGFFLLRGNPAQKTAIFGSSSSNLSFFSSDTTLSSGQKSTPPAFDIAPNSVVKSTPSVIQLALNSAVKVFTVSSKHNQFKPWISYTEECTGSGFVISGKTILTNAHVVADHTSVKVRKQGIFTKYKAKVRATGHECDLAILEVDSEEFWEGMNSLEFGDIPSLLEEVVVVGYPKGGDNISVTKGVVSRIEVSKYKHSATELMTIQIDAAINSGNSGGPVIMENKVVGVAFESLSDSNNIGYIIPVSVIKKFLNSVEENGKHVSFSSMNLLYQIMESSELRDLYKMRTGMTGVLIKQINPLSDAHKFLKKEDVILAIDGVPIGNDGKVPLRDREQIDFTHLVSMKKPCDPALFKVFREGKEYEFNISLNPVQPLLPVHQFDTPPSYYILAGFVFIPLTHEYSDTYGVAVWALKEMPTKVGEQIVIVSDILEDDITTGYSELEDKQVKKVNGVQVDNLKHLRELIEECCTGKLKLEFEEDLTLGLCPKSAKEATCRIMKSHKIPSPMSEDLK